MQHYLGYHNAEDGGPYVHDGRFFTAKSFRPETLVGNTIWVVEGRGKPRQYRVIDTGKIRHVGLEKRPEIYRTSEREDGLTIEFDVDEFNDPVDVTTAEWFLRLKASLQNFSRGFTRLTDPHLVKEIEAAWAFRGTAGSSPLAQDLEAIEADASTAPTIKKRLVDARLGQGKFREKLELRWRNACAVTNCTISSVLRASHIKPWRDANNTERLDQNNGLLLAAHIDALFDSGLVSFRDDGKMLVSKEINRHDRLALQLGGSLSSKLTSAEKKYLTYHRHNIFVDGQPI